MLSFVPRGVLDEILNVIESVSEGFSSYSYHWLIMREDNLKTVWSLLMKLGKWTDGKVEIMHVLLSCSSTINFGCYVNLNFGCYVNLKFLFH